MPVVTLNRAACAMGALATFQIALSAVALFSLNWYEDPEPLVGLGDSQIALAMVLLVCSTLRWSPRLAIVFLLLFSGWVLHYISRVNYMYPMVATDEYFISLAVALAIGGSLLGMRVWRNFTTRHAERSERSSNLRRPSLTLADLFLWVFFVGALLTIGRQAFVQSDRSGIMDPWEAPNWVLIEESDFIWLQLPRLIVECAWYGVMWTAITLWMLTRDKWRWWYVMQIPALFVAMLLGEIVILRIRGLADNYYHFNAIGMIPLIFAGWFREDFLSNTWQLKTLVVTATRLVVFGGSLWLVRIAGYRLDSRLQIVRG